MMKHAIAFLFLVLCSLYDAKAQDFSFVATVNKNSIALNENVQLTLRVSNANVTGRIILPAMADWQVVGGPSTRNEFNSINGRMTVSYSEVYALRPSREGKLTIPEITVQTDKGKLATKSILINVGKANAQPPAGGAQPPASATNAGDFWVEIQLNKKQAAIGEPVLASYVFYSAYDPVEYNEVKFPAPDGFWAESLDEETNLQAQVINGRRYVFKVVKRELLFPQVSGKLEIRGFTVDISVSTGGGFFFRKTARVNDSAKPVTIEVSPYPPGQPAGFLGSYSNMKLDVSADRLEVKANEAINLSAVFNGSGNIKLLEALDYEFPPDFEVFEPKVKDNIRITPGNENGSRTFEYVLIPRSAGTFTLPSMQLSYFDYEVNAYKSLSSPEITFQVLPGDGTNDGNYTFDARTDVELLRQDIRHIRLGDPVLLTHGNRFYGSPLFFGSLALPALLFIGLWWRRRSKDEEEKDLSGSMKKRAGAVARKHLAAASAALKNNAPDRYYAELSRALTGYFAGKFSIPAGEISRKTIGEKTKEVDAQLSTELLAVIDQCDAARFSPTQNHAVANDLWQRASACIEKLENLLAKK
ncbi:MAG: protein BatD [Flavobacteriales bacterium]|nr:protein BatD [Flavobacteriales bacterium]